MSINNNPYNFLNTPVLDAMRKLQKTSALTAVHELQALSTVTAALKMETIGAFAAVRELQSTLNAVKSSMGGATAAFEKYRRTVAPISESIKEMNLAYAPIFEQTKAFDTLNIKGIISGLQTSTSVMSTISGLNFSGIASIIDALPKYDFLSDMATDDFSVDVAEKLYESGEITQLGISEFWEESGVYDLIDSIFGDTDEGIVSEAETKAKVDESKTGKIKKITIKGTNRSLLNSSFQF